MRNGLIISILIVFSGCGQPPQTSFESKPADPAQLLFNSPEDQAHAAAVDALKPVKRKNLALSERNTIERQLRQLMTDPGSTKFGPIAAGVDAGGDINFCVWINSKNGYGGYAGPKPYAGKIVAGKVSQFDIDQYGYDLHRLCSQLGLDLDDLPKPV